MRHSIQSEISKLLVGVVLFVSLLFSSFIFLYSWMVEDNIFNRQVAEEAKYIKQNYLLTGQIIPPRPAYMNLTLNWEGLPIAFKLRYMQDPSIIEMKYADGRTIHIQVIRLGQVDYILTAHVEGYEVSRDYLPLAVSWLAAIILLICLVVAVVALSKARKITRPLNKLAKQVAENISLEVDSIDEDYPSNEIGLLATKTREVLFNLSQALNREVSFTKDVSHEIRTPIAVSKNILAQPLTQVSELEWKQLKTENLRVEQLTETLLALARNESTHTKKVNFTALIEHCLLTNLDINHTDKGRQIRFCLEQEQDVFKQINPHLIEIMVNNLLSNIVQYASVEEVKINVGQAVLRLQNSFTDQVPEFPSKSGQKGAESQGIGHGLNIVERIAKVYNWQVDVSVNDDTFILTIRY